MKIDILGGALPVVGMLGIIYFIKLDCVFRGIGKGWWGWFAHSHGQYLAHRHSDSPCIRFIGIFEVRNNAGLTLRYFKL